MHTVVHSTQWKLFLFSNWNIEQYISPINGQISYTWGVINLSNHTVFCNIALIWIASWSSSHLPESWFLQKPDWLIRCKHDKDNNPHTVEMFKGGNYAHCWYFLPLWHAYCFYSLSWLLVGTDSEASIWLSSPWQLLSHRPRTQSQNYKSGAWGN